MLSVPNFPRLSVKNSLFGFGEVNKSTLLFARGGAWNRPDGLKAAGVKQDMSFITQQVGMFSYSGLSKDQMVRLRNEFGVYGTDTGRMCVAALNSGNIQHVCQSIAKAISH